MIRFSERLRRELGPHRWEWPGLRPGYGDRRLRRERGKQPLFGDWGLRTAEEYEASLNRSRRDGFYRLRRHIVLTWRSVQRWYRTASAEDRRLFEHNLASRGRWSPPGAAYVADIITQIERLRGRLLPIQGTCRFCGAPYVEPTAWLVYPPEETWPPTVVNCSCMEALCRACRVPTVRGPEWREPRTPRQLFGDCERCPRTKTRERERHELSGVRHAR